MKYLLRISIPFENIDDIAARALIIDKLSSILTELDINVKNINLTTNIKLQRINTNSQPQEVQLGI